MDFLPEDSFNNFTGLLDDFLMLPLFSVSFNEEDTPDLACNLSPGPES